MTTLTFEVAALGQSTDEQRTVRHASAVPSLGKDQYHLTSHPAIEPTAMCSR
jgi:hypothetical protein